jgi:hypothetical protein
VAPQREDRAAPPEGPRAALRVEGPFRRDHPLPQAAPWRAAGRVGSRTVGKPRRRLLPVSGLLPPQIDRECYLKPDLLRWST